MENVEIREIKMRKTFMAPIELIWEVWSNPQHIVNWWGPIGFSNTIQKMEFLEGGEWLMTMHGPDRTNFANKSIFKEIIPLKKIVFEHFNPHFLTTVHFKTNNLETEIEWSLLFDNKEMSDTLIRVHKADQGQKQNFDKLGTYLSKLLLNKFAGTWDTQGLIPASDNNPELNLSGIDKYEWIMDGCFLLHTADVMIGNENNKTHEIIGYDSMNDHFTMQYYENKGNSGFMTATLQDGVWIFTGENLRFRGGFNEKEDVFSGSWEQRIDNEKWTHLMELNLSKKI